MAVVEVLRAPKINAQEDNDTDQVEDADKPAVNIPALALNSSPDFVLVWNSKRDVAITANAFERRSIFEYNLEEEGLILQWENCDSPKELHVVKIWAPLEVLKRYSEILKLRLPMKQLENSDEDGDKKDDHNLLADPKTTSLESLKESGCWKATKRFCGCIKHFWTLRLDPVLFPKRRRKLTEIYSRDREYLFDVDESNVNEIFPLAIRARIVQFILRRKSYKTQDELKDDEFAFGYERLVQQGVYDAAYPLHDGELNTKGSIRHLLYVHWGSMNNCLKFQPLDTIKDYFGVNVAIYFAWVGFYTRMLVFASIFGLLCFAYGITSFTQDQYVQDVCNSTANIKMCPMCEGSCGYWDLSDKCTYSKIAHLFDNDLTFLYSLIMSVWCALFLECWKRYSANITHQWDLSNFDLKKDINPRPEYVAALKSIYSNLAASGHKHKATDEEEGKTKDSNQKGKPNQPKYEFELSIPFWSRQVPLNVVSFSGVAFLAVIALAAVIGVIFYRLWFSFLLTKNHFKQKDEFAWEETTVSITAAILNLIFIMIFGKVYEKIALKLTEIEFPRTQPEFENSYTLKIFVLQFINNYSSIFYVAFFKGAYSGAPHKYHKLFGKLRQEECGPSCMPELCIQLAVIMVGKQARNMIVEAISPWVRRSFKKTVYKIKVRPEDPPPEATMKAAESRKASLQQESLQWKKDYDLLEWGVFSLVEEYLDMVLQFGFVTIFVSAFPLAPFFALLNNIFELRIDAEKLLVHYRRSPGLRCKGIGVWNDIIEGIVKVSIISNAFIIALTSNFIPKLMYRFAFLDKDDPNYGTLNGYLRNSLTAFSTEDLETKPAAVVLERTGDSPVCYYPTYRYDYTSSRKYEFRVEHWKLWLARVTFVIMYENLVTLTIVFFRWLIPDISNTLQKQMQKEERMVNEVVLEKELLRAHKTWSAPRHLKRPKSVLEMQSKLKEIQSQKGIDKPEVSTKTKKKAEG